jgi:hypothetical protein
MKDIIIKGFSDVEYIPFEPVGDKSDLRDVRQLQVGYGSKVFRIDREGMWAGAERFADAPWSVDWLGNMVATSLDLSGYLEIGEALTDIGAGNITGTYIASGAITTAKLSATAIDGMTITGALIRTSSSGGRVVMDDTTDSLRVYDTSGNERMRLDADELTFYNASEVLMSTYKADTNYMRMETASGATLGFIFFHNGTQICAITSAGLNMNQDILVGSGTINIGSAGSPFEDIFCDDLRLTSQSSNPTSNGMLRYYNSGGTEGLRMQLGGADFQFDATGV